METKNIMARCIDMVSIDEYVKHEVSFEKLVDSTWQPKTITMMATDPLHAIKLFQRGEV
jgi:hypothetical protein